MLEGKHEVAVPRYFVVSGVEVRYVVRGVRVGLVLGLYGPELHSKGFSLLLCPLVDTSLGSAGNYFDLAVEAAGPELVQETYESLNGFLFGPVP